MNQILFSSKCEIYHQFFFFPTDAHNYLFKEMPHKIPRSLTLDCYNYRSQRLLRCEAAFFNRRFVIQGMSFFASHIFCAHWYRGSDGAFSLASQFCGWSDPSWLPLWQMWLVKQGELCEKFIVAKTEQAALLLTIRVRFRLLPHLQPF